jgi:putative FmdB family regulatory protein
MPMYEFRCEPCGHISSIYFRTASDAPSIQCRYCGSGVVERILSSFASPLSEADKADKLDPKNHKMVDAAVGKAPSTSHPDHYLRKMVPFSQAKE